MPTTKPKLPTPLYTEGAEAERRAVRARLNRDIRNWRGKNESYCGYAVSALECLLAWLNTRDERTAKRRGGVGRK